jgi:hypothetical protein
MLAELVFYAALLVTSVIGVLYFRDLGDVTQMVLKVKRENMLRFIRNEYTLIGIGLGAAVAMTVAHWGFDAGPRWLWWIAALAMLLLYGFPYVWVHVGVAARK